jgi:DNA adenine methylase
LVARPVRTAPRTEPSEPALTSLRPSPWQAPERPPVEPVLKWAGGKTRLLPELVSRLPKTAPRSARYFEPFSGGAALFFHLRPSRASLTDFNPELIHLYSVIRDDVESLIEDLSRHTHERTYYYQVRALDPETLPPIERASRMVFLNRTCFNGLWRVNRDGRFNVPFGSYQNPTLCPADRLRAASLALQDVSIEVSDFEAAVSTARKGDFVYFDPPYVPLTPTASFTSYTGVGFGAPEQQRLADLFTELTSRGVRCMLSNSDTPLVRALYASHHIDRVVAPRSISRDASKREPVGEVIVRNYLA